MLFGSELFEEYIGQLAMASMASLDVSPEEGEIDVRKLQEKMRVKIYDICQFIVNVTFQLRVYLIQY